MITVVSKGEFMLKPLLIIHEEGKPEKYVIQFGLKKAQAILAAMEEIRQFVEENEK